MILLGAISIGIVLPWIGDPVRVFILILVLLTADLWLLALLMRSILRSRLVEPIERLVEGTGRIAGGDFEHRLKPADQQEIEELRTSINTLADSLLEDQALLARNVASLERSNEELVQTRDELIRTSRLASVGTLAAGIAHEVGNPLGALLGFADLARMQAEREGRDPELLLAIRDEAHRIDRIVRTLLEYARGTTMGATLVDPGAVIARVRELLESQGQLDGVRTAWPEAETGFCVHVEAQQLEQVLVNLLLNALDAMRGQEAPAIEVSLHREPGEVRRLPARRESDPPTIDYRHRRRVAADHGNGVPDPVFNASEVLRIELRDHGPGVPEEHLERLFDPFFTTKDPGKGTGLGLAICERLVDGMGGRISVENHPEGGAVFHLRLPISVPDVE